MRGPAFWTMWWVAFLSLGFAWACRGGTPTKRIVEAPAAADAGAAGPAISPPLPSPGRLEDLAAWSDSLPVTVSWVAVVPVADLVGVLRALPERMPRVVRAIDETSLLQRIDRLWGLDLSRAKGDCVFLGLQGKGFAGLCEGVSVGRASGTQWRERDAQGILVRRGDREIRVGRMGGEGPVVFGDASVVSEVLAARSRQMPSWKPVLQRREKELRDLAESDPFRHAALWFLDPSVTPGGDHGRLAALFLGTEGFLAVSWAREGQEAALEKAVRDWWQETVETIRRLTGQDPEQQTEPGAVGDLFKDADTPLESGEVALRGDRVFLRGRGNPLWTVVAARRDLLGRWLADRTAEGDR